MGTGSGVKTEEGGQRKRSGVKGEGSHVGMKDPLRPLSALPCIVYLPWVTDIFACSARIRLGLRLAYEWVP